MDTGKGNAGTGGGNEETRRGKEDSVVDVSWFSLSGRSVSTRVVMGSRDIVRVGLELKKENMVWSVCGIYMMIGFIDGSFLEVLGF